MSPPGPPDDARSIDELYGLEPVIEPGNADEPGTVPAGAQPWTVSCPYCGERFETVLDPSGGSACYVEDCQVCCRPIEFSVSVDDAGQLREVTTLRSD